MIHTSGLHHTTLLDTAVKVTTWGFGAKKKRLLEGLTLYFVTQTLFWLVAQKFILYGPIRNPCFNP